eukprot:gene13807-15878_t
MSLAPEAYEVDCPQVSIVSGIYLQEKPKFYKQVGGRHSLEVCEDDSWGIFHGATCVCYALEKTLYPSAVRSWEYQHGKSYRAAPKMKVRALSLDSQQPTTSRSNPCYVEKASDWELLEERQGMFKPNLKFYRNKVTGAKQRDVPAIITRQLIAATAKPVSSQAENQQRQTNTSISHHNQQQQPQQQQQQQQQRQAETSHKIQTEPIYTFCAYERDLCGEMVKLYAPVSYAATRKHNIIEKRTFTEWATIEKFWVHTAGEMELMIETLQTQLRELTNIHHDFCKEIEPLRQQVMTLQAKQQALSADESRAVQRSNTMLSRHGVGHVKRNDPTRPENIFPNGEQFVASLREDFAPFEDFAMTVTDMLEERGETYPINVFIENLMKPLFHNTKMFVQHKIAEKQSGIKRVFGASVCVVDTDEEEQEDDENAEMSQPKQFFLMAQQPRILADLAALPDQDVLDLLGEARDIHKNWDKQRASFSFLTLARLLLRVHAVAVLSDARFYLYPEIGARVAYRDSSHAEILSPGAKKYGSIKPNEPVEVVLSGVYFDPPQARPRLPSSSGSGGSSSAPVSAVEPVPVFPAKVCRQVGREKPPTSGNEGKRSGEKCFAIGNR